MFCLQLSDKLKSNKQEQVTREWICITSNIKSRHYNPGINNVSDVLWASDNAASMCACNFVSMFMRLPLSDADPIYTHYKETKQWTAFWIHQILLPSLCACPQLTSVLREVKYLGMLKNQNISKAALQLYSKRERLYMVGNSASGFALNSCKTWPVIHVEKEQSLSVNNAMYPVVHTDSDLGDPMVQPAPQHYYGYRAGVGERWNGWDEATAGSGPRGAELGSGRSMGLHPEHTRPGQGADHFLCILRRYLYFIINNKSVMLVSFWSVLMLYFAAYS